MNGGYGIPCEHNLIKSKCKDCIKIMNLNSKRKSRQRSLDKLNSYSCIACGFNHPSAKEVHHLATEYKRFGRSQSIEFNIQDLENNKAVVLCPTCHVLFHSAHGGKNKPFPLYTPQETAAVINKERNPK